MIRAIALVVWLVCAAILIGTVAVVMRQLKIRRRRQLIRERISAYRKYQR